MKISIYLPEATFSNDDIVLMNPEWTSEKIYAKTGIMTRHVVAPGETALALAENAAKGLDLSGVDFLLLCTQSPEFALPSSACLLQNRLGLPSSVGAVAFDHGCSGFVYGLSLAKGLLLSGAASKLLFVTAETYTKYLRPDDRATRTIFGDGAAAVTLDSSDAGKVGDFVFGTDGSGAEKLIVRDGRLFMDGPEIFNFTIDVARLAIDELCARNHLTLDDVDMFVFHQANKFMLDAIRRANKLPAEKFYVNLEETGNTVSSTIPIALKQLEDSGRLCAGMKVMLLGFGVGLSWAGTIVTI